MEVWINRGKTNDERLPHSGFIRCFCAMAVGESVAPQSKSEVIAAASMYVVYARIEYGV